MDTKTILILGGYGNTGRLLARLLLQKSNAKILLGGRNKGKAVQLANELNTNFPGGRVGGVYVDASNVDSLRAACSGCDMIVVASSTTRYIPQVVEAALDIGVDYYDIQYSPAKIAFLMTRADDIQKSGRYFITDGGFHPGLPAVLVRYVNSYFDHLLTANVGSVIKEDWKSLQVEDATVYELVELVNDFDMSIFKGRKWKKASLFSTSDYLSMDFGREFGKRLCAPMMLEEMRQLPQMIPSLLNTGFYVGSFNWFVDWVIMPVSMITMKLSPQVFLKPMGKWMHWGLNTFSKPPYGTLLKIEAEGMKNNQPGRVQVTLSHQDGYMFTVIPVVACLLQYLDGAFMQPGLWMQAHIVEPKRFMEDMQLMGISIQVTDGGIHALGTK